MYDKVSTISHITIYSTTCSYEEKSTCLHVSTCLQLHQSPPEISRTSTSDIMLLKANPKKVTQKPMTHEAACWEASQTTPGYSRKKKVSGRIWQMVKLLNPLKSVDKDAIWGILMVYTYTHIHIMEVRSCASAVGHSPQSIYRTKGSTESNSGSPC